MADIETTGVPVEPATPKDPDQEALERLMVLEERRAERVRKRDAKDAIREAAELEVLEELEDEHGELGKKIARIQTPGGMLVVKRGLPLLFTRFRKSKVTDTDCEQFVIPCLVYPERECAKKLLQEFPGALVSAANKLSELYGVSKEEEAGKY